MVHAAGAFSATPSDELTLRTLPTFFQVLELLLTAGVTTIAEAAFQNRLWQPHLQPLGGLADIRVVQCRITAELAWDRIQQRQKKSATRRAHDDAYLIDQDGHTAGHDSFDRVRLDAPEFDVDTTEGYRPGLDEIVAFVNSAR